MKQSHLQGPAIIHGTDLLLISISRGESYTVCNEKRHNCFTSHLFSCSLQIKSSGCGIDGSVQGGEKSKKCS
jgi:hypothetical protein